MGWLWATVKARRNSRIYSHDFNADAVSNYSRTSPALLKEGESAILNNATAIYGAAALFEKRTSERRARRTHFLVAFYTAFYAFYLVVGGFMFAAMEAPIEGKIRANIAARRATFLEEHSCVSDAELEELIRVVVRASDRGVSAANNVSGEPNWSFGQSLFFSSTVVTTIGYGHVTPLSKEGKVFCILYAMLGIPLTLVLLTALVERLMIPSTMLLQFMNSRLGHIYSPFNIRLLHFILIMIILVTTLILLPAAIFANVEPEWDYLDSLYYCFISLTTVGLGDYIPGDAPNQKYRPLYKVATTGYLFVGLVFVMLALTIFYDIPQLNMGVLFTLQKDQEINDPEKMRLKSSGSSLAVSNYTASESPSPEPYDTNTRSILIRNNRVSQNP